MSSHLRNTGKTYSNECFKRFTETMAAMNENLRETTKEVAVSISLKMKADANPLLKRKGPMKPGKKGKLLRF